MQKSQKPDALNLLSQEVSNAEAERRPVSRQSLTDMLVTSAGIPAGDASNLVHEYCDENAPAIPHYLAEEFAIPYLKVIAVVNVIVALGLYYWGIQVFRLGKQPAWPWFCVATIVTGFAALAWVKSIERFAARKRIRR
jgi:hypothetical protein